MKPLCTRAFAKPSVEGTSLWGLHEAPTERGLHKAPTSFVHIHAHFGIFLQIQGVHYYGDFTKPLYRRGFPMGASQSPL